MQKDTTSLIEPKLKELHGILLKYENERLRSIPNLTNISTTQDTIRTNESKTSEYYKRKLSGHYQTAINDANREIASLKEALQTIHEIRAIRYEKRQSSRNTDGPKETIRRGTLMNLLSQNGMNLPLWIGKKNEPAPPLCGAMPAEQNYVAKIGDMVAALVKITDDEETWILAEVTQYNHSAKMYEVDDIDDDQKERYVLRHKRVIPLPLLRANPETNSEALFPRGTLVLALYPRTTCFYRALVEEPPSKPHEQYQLSFEDSGYDGGYSPPLTVSQRYVISNPKK